jgi:SHAQKYF class myb-like DNA-binding protein
MDIDHSAPLTRDDHLTKSALEPAPASVPSAVPTEHSRTPENTNTGAEIIPKPAKDSSTDTHNQTSTHSNTPQTQLVAQPSQSETQQPETTSSMACIANTATSMSTHANINANVRARRMPKILSIPVPSTVTVPASMIPPIHNTNSNHGSSRSRHGTAKRNSFLSSTNAAKTSDEIIAMSNSNNISATTSEKTASKKRSRAQVLDNLPGPQSSSKLPKNDVSVIHGFQPSDASVSGVASASTRTHTTAATSDAVFDANAHKLSSTSSSLYANPQTSFHNIQDQDSCSGGKDEVVLTKEQVLDVIDTTLPSNFSFQLPQIKKLNPKPKIGRPRIKKPRTDPSETSVGASTTSTSLDRKPPSVNSASPLVSSQKAVHPSSSFSVSSGGSGASSSKTSGRWTREEHEAFLEGLKEFGREWKKVAKRIPTRTSAQIRSHAQKYFAKLQKDESLQAACLASQASGLEGVTSDGAAESSAMDPMRSEYSRSVLNRISKILNDPVGAEKEVEETLTRLKQRYDELRKKLQAQEDLKVLRRHQQMNNPGEDSDGKVLSTVAPPCNQQIVEPVEENDVAPTPAQTPTPTAAQMPGTRSNLPSTYLTRSPITLSSETLALHSSELIALTVLGGELYRSTSHENLTTIASPPARTQPQPRPQSHTQVNDVQGTSDYVHQNRNHNHPTKTSPAKSDTSQKSNENGTHVHKTI